MSMVAMTALALTGLGAFLIAAFAGKKMIPILHKLKFGQTIRDVGPSWHKNKQGTPTMGGLIFMVAWALAIVAAAVVCQLAFPEHDEVHLLSGGQGKSVMMTRLYTGIFLAIGCGIIGFVDDYIKVVKKRNLGLTERQKLLGQLLVATGYAIAVFWAEGGHPHMVVPFIGRVDMGWWFFPFCIFVIVAMVNATNLTDGIDGLCSSVSFIATLFFVTAAVLGMAAGQTYFGQGVVAAALAGALAGFLLYNLHPAKVFMGDTGSLFIGGVLCALAFGMECPLLLIPVGLIYIAETLSVILQVTYFKLTHGKRLFKMSPLHHHFEMSGWSENKVVGVFSFITLAGCIAAVLLLIYA